eukprot:CAMPEP_0117049630 /NCGR_PEP_ID=MMETSP0472-20121206/34263_1 /TAXON_ID=693140 ORGANISM="Tiarina fusus, Strain LIS" /NCGR_SAMPLE_ID=MMETSP0472 /ASSEMBLY_ACC=CAM_ASM_000603 /LENGTH=58 /DNA_ID=CAMNT_0004763097 /DNA_START=13 /DNA_END=189 /DNA_ORIENTATION=-
MASVFEQKAQEASQTKTNSQQSKIGGTWTPHNDGAHTSTGFAKQTRAPPKKKKLTDLP